MQCIFKKWGGGRWGCDTNINTRIHKYSTMGESLLPIVYVYQDNISAWGKDKMWGVLNASYFGKRGRGMG